MELVVTEDIEEQISPWIEMMEVQQQLVREVVQEANTLKEQVDEHEKSQDEAIRQFEQLKNELFSLKNLSQMLMDEHSTKMRYMSQRQLEIQKKYDIEMQSLREELCILEEDKIVSEIEASRRFKEAEMHFNKTMLQNESEAAQLRQDYLSITQENESLKLQVEQMKYTVQTLELKLANKTEISSDFKAQNLSKLCIQSLKALWHITSSADQVSNVIQSSSKLISVSLMFLRDVFPDNLEPQTIKLDFFRLMSAIFGTLVNIGSIPIGRKIILELKDGVDFFLKFLLFLLNFIIPESHLEKQQIAQEVAISKELILGMMMNILLDKDSAVELLFHSFFKVILQFIAQETHIGLKQYAISVSKHAIEFIPWCTASTTRPKGSSMKDKFGAFQAKKNDFSLNKVYNEALELTNYLNRDARFKINGLEMLGMLQRVVSEE